MILQVEHFCNNSLMKLMVIIQLYVFTPSCNDKVSELKIMKETK